MAFNRLNPGLTLTPHPAYEKEKSVFVDRAPLQTPDQYLYEMRMIMQTTSPIHAVNKSVSSSFCPSSSTLSDAISELKKVFKISRTNVASVGRVFNDTRKVKVLSLPETIKGKSTFRAKALHRELVAFLRYPTKWIV